MSSAEPKIKTGSIGGFWALIATQFQGAFNDNLYRFVIVFYMIGLYASPDPGGEQALAMRITALATILFSVPYLLFPGLAGALADRFSKRSITIATKAWEVMVMAFGLVAFYTGNPYFIWFMLYLMFMQSAFFSPAKYGILPEMFPETRLSWANGILGMTTFVAIIAGQLGAGLLYERVKAGSITVSSISGILVALSVVGLGCSVLVTKVPAASPGKRLPVNPWSGLGKYFKLFYADRVLWLTMLGGAYFWLAGAVVQANVVIHGLMALEVNELPATMLLASVLAGIAGGSLAAGYFSRGKIELGLIPMGLGGMTVSGFLLAVPGFSYATTGVLLFLIGFFAGFYQVPLMATLQHRTPDDLKGGMIATFNIATCIGILLGGGIYLLASEYMSTYQVFLLVAVLTLGTLVYLVAALPAFMLRSVLWCFANTVYRIKLLGRDNVPDKGGALLVCNHTSFVDALFITASIDRPVRFIMSSEIYKTWWVRPVARIMGAIPVSSMEGPKELLRSMKQATEALRSGELVCIFAEGQITRTGQMLPFRKGYERIVKGVEVPVIPVYLDRLWGSIFSFSDAKFFWKRPRRIPYPVTVNYGAALPHDVSTFALRNAIRELGTEAWQERDLTHPLLHRGFVTNVRRRPLKMALADANIPHMSYLKTLIASIIFGRKLNRLLDDRRMVGVLVPPTVGGALTNIALQLMGRVPVNLNYTASNDSIASAARQCEITHVITAKAVLEKLPLEVPGESIFLEDVKASVKGVDRIVALLLTALCFLRLCPIPLLEWILGSRGKRSSQDLATVIFSSGSEGEPKGVPLTHYNIASNIEAAMQVFPHDDDESMIAVLPFFHSFGFTGTLWLPLSHGFSAVFHPSPLEAKAIGGLIYKHGCTFLVAAPTFLQNFIRRCLPEELSSVKHCITGAEKLPTRIREAFKTKFGAEPLEGYGTTECSPIVSLNVPDYRAPGYYQVGTKHGTIGQPIPGVSVRVVDPDTGEPMPPDEPGMLLVKGPNIMKGYLGLPEKTAEVLKEGWYTTGDIAKIDEEGFITITDRLARFSKIAGEMVPHTRVEEVLHGILGLTELSLAVTGVPDRSKGERLLVLHTLDDGQLEELLGKLDSCELPNLWIPRANAFYRIDEIPILGTGKMNLREVKNAAKALDVEGE